MGNSVFDKYVKELLEVSKDSANCHSLIESSNKFIDFDHSKDNFFKDNRTLNVDYFCSCDMLGILNDIRNMLLSGTFPK